MVIIANIVRSIHLLDKIESRLRGMVFATLVRIAGGRCGKRVQIERAFRIRHGIHKGISFGDGVYIGRGCTLVCPLGGTFEIGSDSSLTQGVFISAADAVRIGGDVLIGEYSSIRDANHGTDFAAGPIRIQPMIPAPVEIGEGAWIGRGVAVLAGARIGAGAVVGANSVVIGPVPDFAIVVGSPARIVRCRRSQAE